MFIAYCVIAVLYSGMLVLSGVGKLRYDPYQVQIIHDLIGVPLAMFPALAACELAGALGLLMGIRWARLGIAAAIGLVIYFVGAILSHIFAGDLAGTWSPALMLAIASAAFVTRTRTRAPAAA